MKNTTEEEIEKRKQNLNKKKYIQELPKKEEKKERIEKIVNHKYIE